MKFKNKCKLLTLVSFGVMLFLNANNSFAVKMEEYKLIGSESSETLPFHSAPAYKISGSPYFPDGTILYKQVYNDVTYYSPKPPENSVEATDSTLSAGYTDWGFWKFTPNQIKHTGVNSTTVFRTNEYYSEATVETRAKAYGSDSNGKAKSTGTYLEPGTKLKVKSITIQTINKENIEFIYFDTTGTGVSSFNKIARIESKYVKKSSDDEIKKIYFDEILDRDNSNGCYKYYDNFKAYKTVLQRYKGSAHDNLTLSTNKVPDTVKTCALGGKSGEWRYLGVSSKGNIVVNPYFPGELVSFLGNGSLGYYDWRKTPWDATDADDAERADELKTPNTRLANLKSDADLFANTYDAPTYYDKNYKTEKENILQKIIDDGVIPVNGSDENGNRVELTAKQWAERVSLQTNPYGETPIFVGQRRSSYFTQPFAYVKKTNDLYLYEIVVKDSKDSVVASGKRTSASASFKSNIKRKLQKGEYYTVDIKIGKKIDDELLVSSLSSEISITNSENKKVEVLPSHKMTLPNKGGLTEGVNISNTMTFGFKVPDNYTGTSYTIKGGVSIEHTGNDNLDYTNDDGSIKIGIDDYQVNKGDIEAVSIKVLDGTTVIYDSSNSKNNKAITPGKKYNIVYTAKYTGEDLCSKEFIGGKWVNNTNDIHKYSVPLSYSITRKVGSTQSTDGVTKKAYFVDNNNNTSIPMKNNTTFTYTVNDVMLEHTYLDTSFTVTSTNEIINKNMDNDTITATIDDTFDVVISNLRVLPNKEYTLGNNNSYTYNVTYDAKLNTPSYITANDYKTLVDTSININGTQKVFVDLLKPNVVTENISHSVSGVSVGDTTGPYYCEVILNYNKKVYENGGYENNRGITSLVFENVKNPSLGNANDTAKNAFNGTNTSPNKGGDANNNCLIPRNTNTYNSTFSIYNWDTTNVTYTSFSGKNNINFYKYNISSEQTKTVSNAENFVIKDVLFKSKYTTDNNLGAKKDGWVSMVNSKDSIIKAGYGFELKVIVEYKTNALINNPKEVNNKTNGTFVTNLNSGINIIPEIFVEIPGGDTKNILSVNKYDGTKQGLVVKQTKKNVLEGSMQVSEWEYTLKETNTGGIKGVEKIFIPENLKDGDYKLSIYTPPVSGVSSLSEYNTFKYSSLCDRKDTLVTVSGSATDDLNSHITQ